MAKYSKQRIAVIIAVSILVLITATVLSLASGFGKVIRQLSHADIVWLAFVIVAQSFAYWAYVIPYKLVFKLSFKDAKTYSFEGFQPFTRGGGFVYDMRLHKPQGAKARVFYLGIWEYMALAPAVLIAAIYAVADHSVATSLSLPWLIIVPLGTLLLIGVLFYRHSISRFPRASHLVDMMLGMFKDQSWKQMSGLILGMICYWTGEIFALWGALQLFDISLSWQALLIAYASGYSLTRRSLPLAGAGIVLVSLTLSLHWVGTALSVAILAALAYQVSNLLVPLIYHHQAKLKLDQVKLLTAGR